LGLIKADSGNIKRAKKLNLGYMPQAFSPNPFMPLKVLDFCNLTHFIQNNFSTTRKADIVSTNKGLR
jgi:ABC-type Mn2+/Zn2+ transport system ATPase subunit